MRKKPKQPRPPKPIDTLQKAVNEIALDIADVQVAIISLQDVLEARLRRIEELTIQTKIEVTKNG